MKYTEKIRRGAALLIFLGLIFAPGIKASDVTAEIETVLLGGMPFGVSFQTGELKISGFDDIETENGICSPAKSAGLRKNDIIKNVNGKAVSGALDVTTAVKESEGRAIEIEIKRGEETLTFTVSPALSRSSGDFRLGLWLEDGTAGLGTVTYIDKKTGAFGGLGHGILKSDTGELCDFSKGIVSEITVTGVEKGEAGTPGELRGDFHSEKVGVINKNTQRGVFGYITEYPESFWKREVEISGKKSVHSGGASIFSTVDDEGICEYAVEITCIEGGENESKNFLITVTDTALIGKTGGIVRGMSGSPVVQDGKLIGAVTHVLVDDPCRGYGIFIENMMVAAG